MTRKTLQGMALAAAVLLASGVARAQSDPSWRALDAEAMIAACWEEPHKKMEGGSTADLRAAGLEAALCIEARIVEQLEDFLDPDSQYVKERMPDIQAHVRTIGNGIAELFWALYNENHHCDSLLYCGTMYTVMHNSSLAGYYADILRNIVNHRNFIKR